jgi:hypothetical protein
LSDTDLHLSLPETAHESSAFITQSKSSSEVSTEYASPPLNTPPSNYFLCPLGISFSRQSRSPAPTMSSLSSTFPTLASSKFFVTEDRDSASPAKLSQLSQQSQSNVLADKNPSSTESGSQSQSRNVSAPGSPKAATDHAVSLLNPKGRQPRVQDDNSNSSISTPGSEAESGLSMGSMILNLNGVEDRGYQPRKRRKRDLEVATEDDGKSKVVFNNITSSGVVSQYFKDSREAASAKGDSEPIDLTTGNFHSIQTNFRRR